MNYGAINMHLHFFFRVLTAAEPRSSLFHINIKKKQLCIVMYASLVFFARCVSLKKKCYICRYAIFEVFFSKILFYFLYLGTSKKV